MEKIGYLGWENCCRLSNDTVDLIVTLDVGPRIIRFGFVGDENEFKEYESTLGASGGEEWNIYGGHRLWHAPENDPRTYFPDNTPVALEERGEWTRFIQTIETTTGIQKEIDVRLHDGAHVEVLHRLRNTGVWDVELAPWSLLVMARGGRSIFPLPPRGTHPEDLLPASTLTLWSFTDLRDPRWTFGTRFVMLQQDPANAKPQKIGASVPDGWAAYARNNHLFVKRFAYDANARYADFGCNFETFTNDEMLEVESLGPLTRIPPGQTAEHTEHWHLFRDVPMPHSDEDIKRDVLPKILDVL